MAQYETERQVVIIECTVITQCNIYIYSTVSRFVPSQWETSLQSNGVSHWQGANLRISPVYIYIYIYLCKDLTVAVKLWDIYLNIYIVNKTDCVWYQAQPPVHHYHDVIMSATSSQIISLTIVYSTIYSGTDQTHISSTSLAFVWGIHRWLVNSPHKGPVTQKMFPFDDVIMIGSGSLVFLGRNQGGAIRADN